MSGKGILPPPLVSKYIDTELTELQTILNAVTAEESAGGIEKALGMLELAHENMLHMGKLYDLQVVHHGPPEPVPSEPAPLKLTPHDEVLQSFAQLLTAFHFDPRWADHTLATYAAAEAGAASKAGAAGAGAAASSSSARGTGVAASAGGRPVGSIPSAGAGVDDADVFAEEDGEGAAGAASASASASASAGAGAGGLPRPSSGAAAGPASSSIKSAGSAWSPEEIALFEQGIALHSESKPRLIARFMGTRTAEQVRERIKSARRRVKKTLAAQGIVPGVGAGAAGASAAPDVGGDEAFELPDAAAELPPLPEDAGAAAAASAGVGVLGAAAGPSRSHRGAAGSGYGGIGMGILAQDATAGSGFDLDLDA